ncbi:MAG: cyanophycinase [Frankiales bacterium]|nr:cyanophycinase [Frankiales bacterium]
MPGPVALVGSGEYLPVMLETERLLLEGRRPRYVQVPTAAAPEGEESLNRWIALGVEQAGRLGVEPVPVVARDRAEADNPDLAALVAGAGLVYLSGGNPPYLSSVLRGTALWAAIHAAWQAGAALAGCSAGAMALTGWVPDIRDADAPPDPGLGVVDLRVIPHFDRMSAWLPDIGARYLAGHDGPVVGIDEDTAMVRFDEDWVVHGRQSVWVLDGRSRVEFRGGETVRLA